MQLIFLCRCIIRSALQILNLSKEGLFKLLHEIISIPCFSKNAILCYWGSEKTVQVITKRTQLLTTETYWSEKKQLEIFKTSFRIYSDTCD